MRPIVCRRGHRRYTFDENEAWVRFGYPERDSEPCLLRLKDLSASGLSVILRQELPGLEVGSQIDAAEVSVGDRRIRGDLVVMHLTPDSGAGSICGALFFPSTDADLLALRAMIAGLEATAAETRGEAAAGDRAR